ncbi:MAG: SulP family inorganic anion transporter [Nocardioides sp.]
MVSARRRLVDGLLPGLAVLRGYDRRWLRGDVLGGMTVTAYLVPQVMAYSAVAGLPPATGLWTCLAPLLIYAFVGTSRLLSVGPESTTALMTASAIGAMTAGNPERYAAAAAALALVVGAVCLLGRVARLGFLADLLSRPVLVGYMAGIAALMVVSQLGKLTRMRVEGDTPLAESVFVLGHLEQVHLPTLTMAVTVTAALLVAQRLRPRWPNPLLAMLLASLVVWAFGLAEHGVATVGSIPRGMPVPGLPDVDLDVVLELVVPAIGVAIVGYSDNVLTARAFAAPRHERVDADQEFLALGVANLAAGLTHGFPVSSSASRTAIGDAMGARTQVYSLITLAGVVVSMVALGPVLASFPVAALAGVVAYAAWRLVDVAEMRRILRFRRSEALVTAATVLGVLLLGVLPGIGVAVGLSILQVLARVARPHDGILGYAPGVAGMHDVDDYPGAVTVQGLVVYRYDSPLFFANAEDFRRRALASVDEAPWPVEWFLLNMEANVEVNLTALDALEDLRRELAGRGIVVALARVKQELHDDLDAAGFTDRLGADRIYMTLPTAVAGYVANYAARHGEPPANAPPPPPA